MDEKKKTSPQKRNKKVIAQCTALARDTVYKEEEGDTQLATKPFAQLAGCCQRRAGRTAICFPGRFFSSRSRRRWPYTTLAPRGVRRAPSEREKELRGLPRRPASAARRAPPGNGA